MQTDFSVDYRAECGRCLHCAKPQCALSCPIGNDVPQILRLAGNGGEQTAVQLVGHPFGEICGYVCPRDRFCQSGCVLSKRGGIAIGSVEKEIFARYPYKVAQVGNAAEGRRVAVVGGGASGLTFAVKMYEQGASVTVYEPNGLLSTLKLIPDFRLPAQALSRVEAQLKGVFQLVEKRVLREDIPLLCSQYDAVYLATGATRPYGLDIDGEENATPYAVFLSKTRHCSLLGKHVTVVGGGNTAMDCARLAVRSGAKATVLYRRQRADMPAFVGEISAAEEEGVQFVFNVVPVLLQRDERLKLTLAKTYSEGRGKLTVTDSVYHVDCDVVVAAAGASADKDLVALAEKSGVYTGGDVKGGKTVAEAVADGLRAAKALTEKFAKKVK